jgi:hypothetical protein
VTAFPYNYLFYYICLPLILLFMFGLFRLESRLVYALAVSASSPASSSGIHPDDGDRVAKEHPRIHVEVPVLL